MARLMFFSAFIQLILMSCSFPQNLSDNKKVELDTKELQIPDGYLNNLRWNLPLPTIGENGSIIQWTSENTKYISNVGELLQLSSFDGDRKSVKLKAQMTSGDVTTEKIFDVHIAYEEPSYDGYLFAYFEGSGDTKKQEQLRFAVSSNAVDWNALNNNEPIIPSENISQTGGIRDPHILRGEDNKTFYMVATDMFTHKDGWGHNPGIILMKSEDLIEWKHGIIDLAKDYPDKFGDLQWMWAPQSIYDPVAGKYMVYFTIKLKSNDKLDFYSAYANDDFNAFESEPTLMFSAKHGAIDGDIIYKDGLYHLFFKGNTKNSEGVEFVNGIKQAVSASLQGPWVEHFYYLDVYWDTRTNVEGSSVFKLNNSETYILMYDLYSSGRYEYQRSQDLYNFTLKPESFTKNFHPRHGSIISITKEEAIRLNAKWGGVPNELITAE